VSDQHGSSGNDALFCREQAFKNNRLFRISHVFAPREYADGLVALYAFFAAIEQLCSGISDEDVAIGKLNWWRAECLGGELAESRHPILRELTCTGLAGNLRKDRIESLLNGAGSRLDGGPPADSEELKRICQELIQPQLELEGGICGYENGSTAIESGRAARSGLFQLIRESLRQGGQGGYWWLPLNLQARHGISRDDVNRDLRSAAVTELFGELLATAAAWGAGRQKQPSAGQADQRSLSHLYAITGLYELKMSRMQRLSPADYAGEIERIGAPELLHAWKSARRRGA